MSILRRYRRRSPVSWRVTDLPVPRAGGDRRPRAFHCLSRNRNRRDEPRHRGQARVVLPEPPGRRVAHRAHRQEFAIALPYLRIQPADFYAGSIAIVVPCRSLLRATVAGMIEAPGPADQSLNACRASSFQRPSCCFCQTCRTPTLAEPGLPSLSVSPENTWRTIALLPATATFGSDKAIDL